MLHANDDIAHALQADPQGFEAGFAIVFTTDESTMTRDQAYHLVERWRVHGRGLLGQPEARYSTKRCVNWVGYKVHLTETCEATRPHDRQCRDEPSDDTG